MSYQDEADLAADVGFQTRLTFCLTDEAKTKGTADPFAHWVLGSPNSAGGLCSPILATEPGFSAAYAAGGSEAITDGMLLSGVQAEWALLASVFTP